MVTLNVADTLLFNLGIDCFSLAVILVVFLSCRSRNTSSNSEMLFVRALRMLMCVLVTDGVMWAIDGLPGLFVRIAAYAVNIAYFACQILTTVLWFRYSWYRVYRKQMTVRQKRILYIPMALVLLCDLSSPVTGLLFYLDAQNVYHRGALIMVSSGTAMAYICAASVLALAKRKKTVLKADRRELLLISSYAVAPLVGSIVQSLMYGCSLIWPCTAFSTLLIYIDMRNREISQDALTGLNNRGNLDRYLNAHCGEDAKEPLALMMLDVNSFKSINDEFGHVAGDEALIRTADVLRKIFQSTSAFLARYGGDEFIVILPNAGETQAVAQIRAIKEGLRADYEKMRRPFELSVSAGYALYPAAGGAEALLRAADENMYREKRAFHAENRGTAV